MRGGNAQNTDPVTARVWRFEVDGRSVTVVDPDRFTEDQIRSSLELKFGRDRIGRLEEK